MSFSHKSLIHSKLLIGKPREHRHLHTSAPLVFALRSRPGFSPHNPWLAERMNDHWTVGIGIVAGSEAGVRAAPELRIDRAQVIEELLGLYAGQRSSMCHHRVVESKLERVPLVEGETELSGSALIQRIAQSVVEHEDICRARRTSPRILNG